MIGTCSERFERRLVEESAGLRVAIAQVDAALRQEITRSEAALRQEIGTLEKTLRQEIHALEKALRGDLSSIRVDLFKWSFVFWIGQVVAVAGIVGVMLRIVAMP